MSTAAAIVVLPQEKVAEIHQLPIPKVRDEWILVKTKAVALNPTDWKHIDFALANAGARIGVEYAGVVEEVGSKVTEFKKGDRVAGFCHGGHRHDHETGAFGEYALAKAHAQFKIPDNIDFIHAVTLPVAMYTCGFGLYQSLQLPPPTKPTEDKTPLLIYGGSTATGMLGIQYAKLSGLHVIVAASPDHADYLKSLGADDVFDYRSPTCGADINKLTNNKLAYAWDCVGTGEAVCGAALSTTGPSKYGSINLASSAEALKKANPVAEGPLLVLAYNAVGENFEYQKTIIRPSTEEVEFGIEFKAATLELVAKGSLKLVRTAVNNGGSGLEGVMKGMNEMRQGKVRCQKLVYTI